jgi:hypothetical protein
MTLALAAVVEISTTFPSGLVRVTEPSTEVIWVSRPGVSGAR